MAWEEIRNHLDLIFLLITKNCIDDLSDVDIDFITNQNDAEKSFKAFAGNRLYSFLGNTNNNWNLIACVQAYFVEPQHILWATEEEMRQLEYYRSQARLAALEFYNQNQSWITDFLENGIFRKELYHLVYCRQIIDGQPIMNRTQLLDIKRGRANELLWQLILNW